MKWLITGADGQVGRCLQSVLSSRPEETIYALGSIDLDITDVQNVEHILLDAQPDVVINAAAYTSVDRAESEQEKAFLVNAKALEYLANVCSRVGALLIHVSTDYVFDGSANCAYKETDQTSPMSVYGETKLQGEKLVSEYCEQHIIVRTSWVFSEYGNNFVKTMVKLAKERDELGVVADQTGCPTYAGDIAQALIKLAELQQQGKVRSGVYNFTGDIAVSWWGFAREIHQQACRLGLIVKEPRLKAITSEAYPTTAHRPRFSVLDCSKIESLGIRPSNWQISLGRILFREESEREIVLDSRYSTTRKLIKLGLPSSSHNSRGQLGGLRCQGYTKTSIKRKPVVTIITVVFNGLADIESTILSVLNQSYDNLEYIIVDGESTDGTVDIIRKYDSQIDCWVSESDCGIYDAMNKGLSLGTGDSYIFINSGDILCDDVIERVNAKCQLDKQIILGNVKYASGKKVVSGTVGMMLKNRIHHQGVFYPSYVFDKIGAYDLKYKILADYHFNLKMLLDEKCNQRIFVVGDDIAVCSDFGVSDTPKFSNYYEEIKIRYSVYGVNIQTVFLSLYSVLRYFMKRMMRFVWR